METKEREPSEYDVDDDTPINSTEKKWYSREEIESDKRKNHSRWNPTITKYISELLD